LAVSAIFCAVVAARVIYSIRFFKFPAVGMVGIDDGKGVVRLGLYIFCCVLPTDTSAYIPSITSYVQI
jgi:hypothetical protein